MAQKKWTVLETHPWITLELDLSRASFTFWMKLGEAQSKCQHIAGVPLPPRVQRKLQRIYSNKGVHATTSIEGNTLTVKQVGQVVRGKSDLPKSQKYLGIEVENVLSICNEIAKQLDGEPVRITPELIRHYNKRVLRDLETDEGVEPGVLRTYSVGVGNYRAVPWKSCPELLDRLCDWLNEGLSAPDDSLSIAFALIRAVVAHLYIAWVHPFGDGNGRTARLVEFLILAQAGIPLPAAHLLSNHYNKTRPVYYAELDRSSRGNAGPVPFVTYAIEGFVDGLAEQLKLIRRFQWQVAWEDYIHDRFREKPTPAANRQKHLILDLPNRPVSRVEMTLVTPRVARDYADKGEKTLTRDINALIGMQLLRKDGRKYQPNRELILAFRPKRRSSGDQPSRLPV